MLKAILEAKDLEKTFKNGFKSVDGISFTVNEGDIFGFLGPNGAGKTTTIRMLLGIMKPTNGSVIINGYSVGKEFYKAVSKVGALIEGPDFYDYLSARKNLEIFATYSGVKDLKQIDNILDIVGIDSSRANDIVRNYSLGMKQRLGIAQTLLNNPDIIILDEPTNGLDPYGIRDMRTLIKRLSEEKGITIIISSHILYEIQQICNRVLIINNGKKVLYGDVEEILNSKDNVYEVICEDKERFISCIKNIQGINMINSSSLRIELNSYPPEKLLRKLVEDGLNIKAFYPYKINLEEVFFNVLEE